MADSNDFDDWSFYEDEISQPSIDIYNICFPIFNKCCTNTEKMSLATGFLIGNDGKFLSAGHLFKGGKDLSCFKVYFKGREYAIKCLFFEYEKQLGKDLFIGELVDFTDTIVNEFHLVSSDSLEIGQSLKVIGFNSINLPGSIKNEYEGQKFYYHPFNTSLASLETKVFTVPCRIYIDKRLNSPNIKILEGLDEDKYKGISGSPVYFGQNIYGVCIADLFITSEYIISLLE